MKEYPTIEESADNKVAESAVYAIPPTQSVQQATMDAIMLMFSTLDSESKRAISYRIQKPTTMLDEEADRILAKELDGLPSWDEVEHGLSMDSLDKQEYMEVVKANRRKPMKGIEKRL